MEEQKKGQSTFYAIIGVATLVVAIIGATFAYFSAQATAEGDDIEGGTNDIGGSLSLTIERVLFGEETTTYNNLVPAIIDVNTNGVAKAVGEKCIAGGYTGCHLYDIKASATQDIDAASIRLTDLTVSAADQESWKYIIYTNDLTGEDASYETVSSLVTGSTAGTFDDFATTYPTGFDMHNAALTKNEDVHYYLLVYLANKEAIQNPDEKDTDNAANSGVGTYSGEVTMDVGVTQVVANFSTSVVPPEEP